MNIMGNKVVLRAMELRDMDFLVEMMNDPEMESNVIGWSFPISRYEQEKWYERAVNDKLNLRFMIETRDTGEVIGMANLVEIDWKNRKATHGIKLSKDAPKGRGYATDAVNAVMKYAFEELQLNRLNGSWFEHNIASQKLYTKCGWSVEGVVRHSIFKNNQYRNEVIVGILREDYEKLMGRCKE